MLRVVPPSAKRTRLMPKSSLPVAVSVIVAPGLAVAGALSETPVGTASSIGSGAVMTGHAPVIGSDCGPLRYGKKSTDVGGRAARGRSRPWPCR